MPKRLRAIASGMLDELADFFLRTVKACVA